jgi:hypothetical protein
MKIERVFHGVPTFDGQSPSLGTDVRATKNG